MQDKGRAGYVGEQHHGGKHEYGEVKHVGFVAKEFGISRKTADNAVLAATMWRKAFVRSDCKQKHDQSVCQQDRKDVFPCAYAHYEASQNGCQNGCHTVDCRNHSEEAFQFLAGIEVCRYASCDDYSAGGTHALKEA